jgi:hypothetical protein
VEKFDIYELILAGKNVYKNVRIEDLKNTLNHYPIDHASWVQAQKVTAQHFNNLVKSKWAESLAYSVTDTLDEDFNFESLNQEMEEDQLDANIGKVFNQIKQFQQNLIFTTFENGLRDYICFLIGFAYRNDDIRNSRIMNTIRRQKDITLIAAYP